MDNRDKQLQLWLNAQFPKQDHHLHALNSDASFRRYYRLTIGHEQYVVADAPPETEKNHEFVRISDIFARSGIKVPNVFAKDMQHGFMVLTDFGDRLLFDELNQNSVVPRYQQAIHILKCIHQLDISKDAWSQFDSDFMCMEMQRFPDWFVEKFLKIKLTQQQQTEMTQFFHHLADSIMHQPRVCIHRDFHSRNLMILQDDSLGVIDFQDAMIGPLAYDIISLIKDCYIDWPDAIVQQVLLNFFHEIVSKIDSASFAAFELWCHQIILQRHLKCLGIFARLAIRDNKKDYLKNVPRMLSYIIKALHFLPEYSFIQMFITKNVLPHYPEVQEQ